MGGSGWRYPSAVTPLPVPTQERAASTIRAAIEATAELLDRLPEQQVTLEAIRLRSGVSQGSLSHHFGGRNGVIAAANVERYARTCAADEQFLGQLEGTFSTTVSFVTTMLDLIDHMLSPERRTVRWLRMSAVAAALHDPSLTDALSAHYTSLTSRMAALVEDAQRHGVCGSEHDARTIALLLTMQAQGLVLDDLAGTDVTPQAWSHLQACFVASFATPETTLELERQASARHGDLWRAEVFGAPGRIPEEVKDRLDALRILAGEVGCMEDATDPERARALLAAAESGPSPAPHGAPRTTGEPRHLLLHSAVVELREHGARGVDTNALRETVGMSPQTFHRMFGTRDELIRESRIRLEISRAALSAARFATLVVTSRTREDFRHALEADAIRMSEDGSRTAMWQRIETLSASRTDDQLRLSLARIQRTARDLLIEQVCLAQSRGLIDPELPARGVARLLDGSMFWHVFHGLDAERPDRATWTRMLRRIAEMLSPEG
jgi:AcrR family transcriptional regulator